MEWSSVYSRDENSYTNTNCCFYSFMYGVFHWTQFAERRIVWPCLVSSTRCSLAINNIINLSHQHKGNYLFVQHYNFLHCHRFSISSSTFSIIFYFAILISINNECTNDWFSYTDFNTYFHFLTCSIVWFVSSSTATDILLASTK